MISRVYGLNIAVADLASASKTYEGLLGRSSTPLEPRDFSFPGLVGSSFDIEGFKINLIASTEPGTSVAKFLEQRSDGMFLLSLQVDDIELDTHALRERGFKVLLEQAADSTSGPVNFIHPKSANGVQIELIEPSKA